MTIEYFQQKPDRGRDPSKVIDELGVLSFKMLNRSLSDETRLTLVKHGMPPSELPSVGNMLEMIIAPELPLLDRATEKEQETWSEWVAHLFVLYGHHADSEAFLSNPRSGILYRQFFDLPEGVTPPQLPFSRSGFALLSFSREIAEALGQRIGGIEGPSLGRAFQFELRRTAKIVEQIAELSTAESASF